MENLTDTHYELRVVHGHKDPDEKINWLPGDRVRLFPEPTHEGPHPDDQFGPKGEVVEIIRVDRHRLNPSWVIGFTVRGDSGEYREIKRGAVMSMLIPNP